MVKAIEGGINWSRSLVPTSTAGIESGLKSLRLLLCKTAGLPAGQPDRKNTIHYNDVHVNNMGPNQYISNDRDATGLLRK